MKENDVYKWHYNSNRKDISYHCKERLAVIKKDKGGKLYLADIYWGVGDNSGAVFDSDDPEIDIEYYTNLDEAEAANKIYTYKSLIKKEKDNV